MSVWYEVSGNCKFNRSCGLSIATLLKEEIRIEGKPYTIQRIDGNIVSVQFYWTNSLDGMDAAKEVKRFVDEVKRFDHNATIEIMANIRFLA